MPLCDYDYTPKWDYCNHNDFINPQNIINMVFVNIKKTIKFKEITNRKAVTER